MVNGSGARPASRRGRAAGLAALGVVALAVLAAAGVGLVALLNNLANDVAAVRRDLHGANERMTRLERRIDELALAKSQPASERPADPPAQTGAIAGGEPLELGQKEIQLLRDYIKVPPGLSGAAPAIGLGGAVPWNLLMPMPSQIADRIPQLVGARFMTDRNGAIVIVRRGSRQADAVIAPY
jgi:hypothetical protein